MTEDRYILEHLDRLILSTEARANAQTREIVEQSQRSQSSAQQEQQMMLLAENLLALRRLRLQALNML